MLILLIKLSIERILMSEKIHTTLNLSKQLMKDAMKLFKNKTKTEIIHEALARMIQSTKLQQHFKNWMGKGNFKYYD